MKIKNVSLLTGLLPCFLLSVLLHSSCRQAAAVKKDSLVKTGSADIKYAKGFSIDYFNGYKLVNLYSFSGARKDTLQYVLLERDALAPKGFKKEQLIRIPLQRMVATSSMHIALADFTGDANVLTGLSSLQYVFSAAVRKNIDAGKVKEVGPEGAMNNEMLIAMKPDLVMVVGSPEAKHSKYATLSGAGIPVLFNSEWLETTPLARAEWVKLMAALMNKEELVDRKFSATEKEYQRLAEMGRKATIKPRVISGMPYKGIWNVPGGDSYMGAFFNDAGMTYKWSGLPGKGSLSVDFETVAPEALKADFWLNIGTVDAKKDMMAIDARYADFKPFKTGNLYNNTKKTNDLGTNDYWESGAFYPQVVLADLLKILHPELLPHHELVYYKKLN